jgi:hypothetical protein
MPTQKLTSLTLSELANWSPVGETRTADKFIKLMIQSNIAFSEKYSQEKEFNDFLSRTELCKFIRQSQKTQWHHGLLTGAIFRKLMKKKEYKQPLSAEAASSELDMWAEGFLNLNENLVPYIESGDDFKAFCKMQASFDNQKSVCSAIATQFQQERSEFIESIPEAEFYATIGNLLFIELNNVDFLDKTLNKDAERQIMRGIEKDILNKISSDRANALRFYLMDSNSYIDVLCEEDRSRNLLQFCEAIFERKTGLSPVSWRRGWKIAADRFGGDQSFNETFLPSLR